MTGRDPDTADGPGSTLAALAYGRLAIATLASTTLGSAAALTVALAILVAAPRPLPGLPYADIPAALAAIGAAAALSCLASATAYFAQAYGGARATNDRNASRTATTALMSAAYIAFAIGGAAFTHFCLAAIRVLGRL